MLALEPEIEREYERFASLVPNIDEDIGRDCLSIREILRAHFEIANRFYLEGYGLGGVGPRDINLLVSAAFRQGVSFEGFNKWDSGFEKVATLFFGLIKNHPFHDANKRTAFLCALLQLYKMGWCPSISEKELEDFTVDVADRKLGRFKRYREIVKVASLIPR